MIIQLLSDERMSQGSLPFVMKGGRQFLEMGIDEFVREMAEWGWLLGIKLGDVYEFVDDGGEVVEFFIEEE